MKKVFEQLNNVILNEVKDFVKKAVTLEGTALDNDLLTKLPAILLRKDSVIVDGNEHLKIKISLLLISKIGKANTNARFKEQSPIIEALMIKLHKKWLTCEDGDLGRIEFTSSKNLYSPDRAEFLKEALEFTISQVPYPTDYDENDLNEFKEIQQKITLDGYEITTKEMLSNEAN